MSMTATALCHRVRQLVSGQVSARDRALIKAITQVAGTDEYQSLDKETREAVEEGIFVMDLLHQLEHLPILANERDHEYAVLVGGRWHGVKTGELFERDGLVCLSTVSNGQPWIAKWPAWGFVGNDGVVTIRRP